MSPDLAARLAAELAAARETLRALEALAERIRQLIEDTGQTVYAAEALMAESVGHA